MKNSLIKNSLLIFAGTIIAFVFVPLFMIGNSPSDYTFIDTRLFFKIALLFSITVGILLSLINTLLHILKLNKISTFLIYFSLTWIIMSGFIFPVVTSTGMVDPEFNTSDKLNILIVIIISLIFSIASLTVFKKNIQIFLLIVTFSSLLPAILSIYSSDSFKFETNNTSLELSNKKNILVISFDGMPGQIVNSIIKNNTEYNNKLKDFTIFENAVSQAPATTASLIGDIYGIQDYKLKGKNLAIVKNTMKQEGFLAKTTGKKIEDTFQYKYGGFDIKPIKIKSLAVKIQQKTDTFYFFKYPIIRLFTRHGLGFVNREYNAFKIYFIPKIPKGIEIVKKLKAHKGASWDKKMILTLNSFDSFVSDISATDKEISLRYLHFTFTHFPVYYDTDCNYRSDNKGWYDANQNEKGIKNQDICAVGKFIGFLDKLKELQIYNNSLVIFKSDHGKPTTYFSQSPNNLSINEHKMWGYSRYHPVLMIKGFNINQNKPIYKSELVLLNDIAKTICEESSVHTDCNIFHGVNLLNGSLDNNESYYIYVVKDEKASFVYEDHISVKIDSRKNTLLNEMKYSKQVSLSVADENIAFNIRKLDLEQIEVALLKYYKQHGKYPVSTGWDGIYTNWGKSTSNYIENLSPNLIKILPIDPRNSKDGGQNYLYKSNGNDYKFIVHGAPNYDLNRIDKKFIDPTRKSYAYGIWTRGAKLW